MSASSLEEAFGRLVEAAERLNSKTDAVNDLIARTDERLRAVGLGIEVWLPGMLAFVGDSSGGSGYKLGFAKVKGEWQLAVQEAAESHKLFEGQEDQPYVDERNLGEPVPLIQASRMVRVEACTKLPELVTRLADRAEALVGKVDELSAPRTRRRP